MNLFQAAKRALNFSLSAHNSLKVGVQARNIPLIFNHKKENCQYDDNQTNAKSNGNFFPRHIF